jgi:hypothetical protein
MSGSPEWVSITQLLLTGLLGIGAGAIAFMQWRTAHQKMVLDLFEKRAKVINTTLELILTYPLGKKPDYIVLVEHATNARNLFGRDVFILINEVNSIVWNHKKEGPLVSKKELSAKYVKIVQAASPYMRMDQKLVRTPTQWFSDKNKVRKSYGDYSEANDSHSNALRDKTELTENHQDEI